MLLRSGSEEEAENSNFPDRVYFSLANLPLVNWFTSVLSPIAKLVVAHGLHGLMKGMHC